MCRLPPPLPTQPPTPLQQEQTRLKPAGHCPQQEGLRAPSLPCPHRQTLQTRGSPPRPPPQWTPHFYPLSSQSFGVLL